VTRSRVVSRPPPPISSSGHRRLIGIDVDSTICLTVSSKFLPVLSPRHRHSQSPLRSRLSIAGLKPQVLN
ncbi:hypothetical protein HAX54_002568, partial [Datura stramonium]|nr:hypothetical protein [Datura stramonium]